MVCGMLISFIFENMMFGCFLWLLNSILMFVVVNFVYNFLVVCWICLDLCMFIGIIVIWKGVIVLG